MVMVIPFLVAMDQMWCLAAVAMTSSMREQMMAVTLWWVIMVWRTLMQRECFTISAHWYLVKGAMTRSLWETEMMWCLEVLGPTISTLILSPLMLRQAAMQIRERMSS